jgi:hypothetical protein
LLVTSSGLAAAAVVAEKVLDAQIPGWLFALAFLWIGGMLAAYRAWDDERAEVERLQPPRPALRLDFDRKDPLCIVQESTDQIFRVQVWNDGDRRAEGVRVVLHEVEPPERKALLQSFTDMSGQETFSVSPSEGKPAGYVNVLMQRRHSGFGNTQRLLAKSGADWLRRDTKELRVVLRLEADQKAHLLELLFTADQDNRMQVQRLKTVGDGSENVRMIL